MESNFCNSECMAEYSERPLLSLSEYDLGLNFNTNIQAQLEEWFTLAACWQAVLLIDEADLVLEERESGNLRKNSLVTGIAMLNSHNRLY